MVGGKRRSQEEKRSEGFCTDARYGVRCWNGFAFLMKEVLLSERP